MQNVSLQQLLVDKDWLIKEVHHRVKNNLHLIVSLLETQSSYLYNNAALEAIVESQSRIQAIALIHQKLYLDANVSTIDMSSYIQELIHYITDSFGTSHFNIFFLQNLENIFLDVEQAIPVGLILTEAITNAIKYAFKGRDTDNVPNI